MRRAIAKNLSKFIAEGSQEDLRGSPSRDTSNLPVRRPIRSQTKLGRPGAQFRETRNPSESKTRVEHDPPDAGDSLETVLKNVVKEINDCEKIETQLISHHAQNVRLNDLKALLESHSDDSLLLGQRRRKHGYLAWVHICLGSYEEVDFHYRTALPQIFRQDVQSGIESVLRNLHTPDEWFRDAAAYKPWKTLSQYLSFLIETQSNLELAEDVLDILPWLSDNDNGNPTLPDSMRQKFLLLKIRLLNAQRKEGKALMLLARTSKGQFEATFEGVDPILSEREQAQALTVYAMHNALCDIIMAVTFSMIGLGAWHRQTLNSLYYLGKTLRERGHDDIALIMLRECCIGFLYRFGNQHPSFLKAHAELQLCDQDGSAIRTLSRFESLDVDTQYSVAFEHVYVNTVVDVLEPLRGLDYANLGKSISSSKIRQEVPFRSQGRRTYIRCKEECGLLEEAIKDLDHTSTQPWEIWEILIVDLDRIRITSKAASREAVDSLVVTLLLAIGRSSDNKYDSQRYKAICRKLSAFGTMHFSPSSIVKLVDEEHAELLGKGTYAVVDSIKIGQELYARKSFALPRFRQQQTRDAIQNEISIIRTLEHPHIIKVFFTYELNSHFSVVMEPLAECDLETYLLQYSSTPPNGSQDAMIWRWLLCLSNTLAFIHSKDVRHKDIKPRNILVKGQDVIFADFGSSHAFLDEGDSATEGPSYGHTKMYCAPEVIGHQRRNRSADIFSLGCVFTELAVWLAGKGNDFDIQAWHAYRNCSDKGLETNAYHTSLDKIKQWFEQRTWVFLRQLYRDILGPMLDKDPTKRPTARDVSKAIPTLSKTTSLELKACKRCYLGLWVDDERFPIPSLLPQTDNAESITKTVPLEMEREGDAGTPEGLNKLQI